MKKIVRNLTTDEARAFWDSAEKIAAQAQGWPPSRRAGINVSTDRQVPRGERVMATSLADAIAATCAQPGFLREYDRLCGTSFSRGGILRAIDEATGKFDDDCRELVRFIAVHIWAPVVVQEAEDKCDA